MTPQTQAAQNILNSINNSLQAACVSYPQIMLECILDEAQELVNEQGYRWDVALAIACKIYPCTAHCGRYAYSS